MDKRSIACVLTLLLAACGGAGGGENATARVGAVAPDWSDPLLSGGTLSMAQLRGKPLLLDFFATWCPPCNAEAPMINAAYETYKSRGLHVVGVDVQENAAKAHEFVTKHGLRYPALVDAGTLLDQYQINGMPVAVFIDKSGVVKKIDVGELTQQRLDADITAIL